MEKLMTPDEVAELLRLKKSTVYAYVLRKKIPYLKIGTKLLFKPSAIAAWVEAQNCTGQEAAK